MRSGRCSGTSVLRCAFVRCGTTQGAVALAKTLACWRALEIDQGWKREVSLLLFKELARSYNVRVATNSRLVA